MYDFMYVDPEKIPGEHLFPVTIFCKTKREGQIQYYSQNFGLYLVSLIQNIMS